MVEEENMLHVTPDDPTSIINAFVSDPAARRLLATFGSRPMPCIDCGRVATRLAVVMVRDGTQVGSAPNCDACYRRGLAEAAALVPRLPVVDFHAASECDGRCAAGGQ